MNRPFLRRLLYVLLILLYVLHTDWWLWDDGRLWLGLPAGLTYHLGYCAAAALLLGLLVRWAWPAGLDEGEEGR